MAVCRGALPCLAAECPRLRLGFRTEAGSGIFRQCVYTCHSRNDIPGNRVTGMCEMLYSQIKQYRKNISLVLRECCADVKKYLRQSAFARDTESRHLTALRIMDLENVLPRETLRIGIRHF